MQDPAGARIPDRELELSTSLLSAVPKACSRRGLDLTDVP